jgi:hypothetical protein
MTHVARPASIFGALLLGVMSVSAPGTAGAQDAEVQWRGVALQRLDLHWPERWEWFQQQLAEKTDGRFQLELVTFPELGLTGSELIRGEDRSLEPRRENPQSERMPASMPRTNDAPRPAVPEPSRPGRWVKRGRCGRDRYGVSDNRNWDPAAVLTGSVADLLQLTEVKPDQIALPARIDDHVAGSVIRVSLQQLPARRTRYPPIELTPIELDHRCAGPDARARRPMTAPVKAVRSSSTPRHCSPCWTTCRASGSALASGAGRRAPAAPRSCDSSSG